jgi:WD40 repeat protein
MHIIEVFNSSLSDFLNTQSAVLPDVGLLLDWHLARLTEFEKEILYWLAINQIPSTLEELRTDLLTTTSKKTLPATVQRLRQRTVIEEADGGFFLQPVLIEYLNERLVDEIEGGLTLVRGPLREELLSRLTDAVAADMRESRFTMLNRHALLKATARSDVREAQQRFLLEPLLRRLEDGLGSRQAIKDHCIRLLDALREATIQDGYAAGNILNLLCVGGYDLTGLDFSGLAIRQGALDSMDLPEVNFTSCRFSRTTFRSSFGSVLSLAWSPNDSLLAAGTASCEVLIWNVESRQLKWSLIGHTDWVRAVGFLSESEVVTAGDDGTVRLWSLVDEERPVLTRVMSPERGWIRDLAIDPRRRLVAGACQDGSVLLWDLDRGTLLTEVAQHEGPCLGLYLDPETRVLVSVGVDGVVDIRNLMDDVRDETSETAAPDPLQWAKGVTCYCVSASQGLEMIVVGTSDGDVLTWEPSIDQRQTVTLNLLRPVRAVAAARDGQSFWVTCSDNVARSVTAEHGTVGQALLGHTAAINTVAQSASGSLVATGADDQTVRLWNARSGKSLAIFSGFSGAIRSLASIDGTVIITLGEDRELRYWESVTGREIYSVRSEKALSWPVAVEPSAQVVACASTDGMLRIFDRNGQRIGLFPAHRGPIRAVNFSRSGSLAATGGADHLVRIWDARTWTPLAILEKHTDWVRAVSFLDDNVVASASDDGSVLIWDLNALTSVELPREPKDLVHCLAVDVHRTQRLVCGSEGGHVEAWDVESLTKVMSWKITGSARSLAVSAEGDRVMAGGFGGEIHVWNLHTGQAISRYAEHEGWVRSLVFMDSNGSSAASCSADGCARLWDVDSGATRRTLRPNRPYEGMIISQAVGLDVGTMEKLSTLGARMGGQ